LAAGDWRYYRVEVPVAAPAEWNVSFTEQSGEVELYVRDTSPPGRGYYSDWVPIRDWSSDSKNQGPYPGALVRGTHTFTPPPLRPGHTYYLGFRARSDAVFSVSSLTSGGTLAASPLDFFGGTLQTSLAPRAAVLYRVDVPPEATRWRHTATHVAEVLVCLEQGSLPRTDSSHWRSFLENSPLSQGLNAIDGWPWLPNQSYYLLVTNTTDQTQPFTLVMDGRTAATEDEDLDGLPDVWETQQFGNLWAQSGASDADNDGLTNLEEFQLGSNPLNSDTRGRLDTIQVTLAGEVQLHVVGEPGLRYELQGSENLFDWFTVDLLTNSAGGLWFRPGTSSRPAQFYRTVIQP
jgi:hypothetical protein